MDLGFEFSSNSKFIDLGELSFEEEQSPQQARRNIGCCYPTICDYESFVESELVPIIFKSQHKRANVMILGMKKDFLDNLPAHTS
jgi:hypothetical protein